MVVLLAFSCVNLGNIPVAHERKLTHSSVVRGSVLRSRSPSVFLQGLGCDRISGMGNRPVVGVEIVPRWKLLDRAL